MEDNRLGPAAAALNSAGSAPASAATRQALELKHPQGTPPPAEAAPPALTPTASMQPDEVLKALRSFPRGSAAGPSGLRPQHLLDGVRERDQRAALEALTDALNTLVAGRVPTALAPALAGASLFALNKDDGDVRPIAVGETVRRLASKCLCAATKEEAASYLRPLQVGVACPLGAEAAVKVITQYVRRHANSSDKVVLKVDFANAFNTVNREAFLRACSEHAPEAAKWAWWCYSQPSDLHYEGQDPLRSCAGVQQGDNLGPLLFSLALQPTLLKLAALKGNNGGLDVVAAYLDDVVVAGDTLGVQEALRILHEAAPGLGLALKLEKCELIPTAGDQSTVNLTAFPQTMKRKTDGNFDLLGAPIGHEDFCKDYLRAKRVRKARTCLEELKDLGDSHAAYKILSNCLGSCKMMYAMRTTRSDWAQEVCGKYDALVRETAESMLGTPLQDLAWEQASLSTSGGGLGLRSSSAHAPAAFVASSVGTRSLCLEVDPNFIWETQEGELAASTARLNAALAPSDHFNLETLPAEEGNATQTELSAKIEALQVESLRARGNVTDKARLRAAAAPHAGAWLNAPATRAFGLHLTSAEFMAAALFRVGGCFLSNDVWCPRCDQTLQKSCNHAVRCRGGGDITIRHNSLRDECYFRCLSASIEAEREVSGLLPSDPQRRPADVFLPACPGLGAVALDFAVTCPLQETLVRDAAGHTLAAAMNYEAQKLADRQTAQRCTEMGFKLTPMVAESLGGWGPAAQGLFREVAKATAQTSGLEESVAVSQLYEAMGIRLQRANARAILTRLAAALNTSRSNTALAATSRSEAALVLTTSMITDI